VTRLGFGVVLQRFWTLISWSGWETMWQTC